MLRTFDDGSNCSTSCFLIHEIGDSMNLLFHEVGYLKRMNLSKWWCVCWLLCREVLPPSLYRMLGTMVAAVVREMKRLLILVQAFFVSLGRHHISLWCLRS